jgi:hypothetical protein
MTIILKIAISILVIFSFVLFILNAALNSKFVQNFLLDKWVSFEHNLEEKRRKIFIFYYKIFISIYENKHGNISILKFIFIITIINFPFIFYYKTQTNRYVEEVLRSEQEEISEGMLPGSWVGHALDNAWIDLYVYSIMFCIGVFIFEYYSYIFTKKFLRMSAISGKKRYIFFDVIALFILFYIVPIFYYYDELKFGLHFDDEDSWSSNNAKIYPIFHAFPIAPLYYILNDTGYLRYILLIPFLSLCFPTSIYIASSIALNSRTALKFFSKFIEKIYNKNNSKISFIVTICSLFSSVLGLFLLFE